MEEHLHDHHEDKAQHAEYRGQPEEGTVRLRPLR
jgi:hypothetical protein